MVFAQQYSIVLVEEIAEPLRKNAVAIANFGGEVNNLISFNWHNKIIAKSMIKLESKKHPIEFLPESYHSVGGAIRLFIGGVLIGFGTRYAGGCTSGHAITGIANLNWPSLVATIFFFVGGLAVTWGLGSLIF